MEELEFTFQGMAVGCFTEAPFPTQNGLYGYMPYQGPGHFEMQQVLKDKGAASCYYDTDKGRHFFDVLGCPEHGQLKISGFTLASLPEKNRIGWLEPWVPAMPGSEKELEKEVALGHPLFQCKCAPIARRIDKDDVLFQVQDHGDLYAEVHLTWSGRLESDPRLPTTLMFHGIEEWIEKRMKKDHQEYMGGM